MLFIQPERSLNTLVQQELHEISLIWASKLSCHQEQTHQSDVTGYVPVTQSVFPWSVQEAHKGLWILSEFTLTAYYFRNFALTSLVLSAADERSRQTGEAGGEHPEIRRKTLLSLWDMQENQSAFFKMSCLQSPAVFARSHFLFSLFMNQHMLLQLYTDLTPMCCRESINKTVNVLVPWLVML